ncbi:MAG: hypothetical protein JNM63_12430, partial [Spirochaetia bacterium]|nr:hypothetical protein [Spirochaetia bacterium]
TPKVANRGSGENRGSPERPAGRNWICDEWLLAAIDRGLLDPDEQAILRISGQEGLIIAVDKGFRIAYVTRGGKEIIKALLQETEDYINSFFPFKPKMIELKEEDLAGRNNKSGFVPSILGRLRPGIPARVFPAKTFLTAGLLGLSGLLFLWVVLIWIQGSALDARLESEKIKAKEMRKTLGIPFEAASSFPFVKESLETSRSFGAMFLALEKSLGPSSKVTAFRYNAGKYAIQVAFSTREAAFDFKEKLTTLVDTGAVGKEFMVAEWSDIKRSPGVSREEYETSVSIQTSR